MHQKSSDILNCAGKIRWEGSVQHPLHVHYITKIVKINWVKLCWNLNHLQECRYSDKDSSHVINSSWSNKHYGGLAFSPTINGILTELRAKRLRVESQSPKVVVNFKDIVAHVGKILHLETTVNKKKCILKTTWARSSIPTPLRRTKIITKNYQYLWR